MTYNIRFDNPGDGIHAWDKRKDSLLVFLRSEHLAILCIQEGLHRQVNFLKEKLPNVAYRGVGREDGRTQGEYSAVFLDTTRFVPLRHGTFWLSPQPDTPSIGWDAALPRIVTWVHLRDGTTNKSFFVFNTHFDHQGVKARENSALLLRAKIRDIAGASPSIVTGDFNAAETERPYQILVSRDDPSLHLLDSRYISRKPPEGPLTTFTGFEITQPLTGDRIDFIFVTGSLHVLDYRTIPARRAAGYLSDHLPVVVDVLIP
jgi:endonuclease/exonuclease/phosphatase family metal-dependent hydrolase